MQVWWFKCLMFALVLAGVVGAIQVEVDAGETLPIEANLWWGEEYGEHKGLLGEFSGAEIYLPGFFSCCSNVEWLVPEFRWENSQYNNLEQNMGIGLRANFAHVGVGLGMSLVNYNDQYQSGKAYGWIALYRPDLDARLYFDFEPANYNRYGKVSVSADWLGRPIGLRGSYIGNITPFGEYKELRADASSYLGYPCTVCWESEYDCDLRAYIGPKLAQFSNYQENWDIYWIGVVSGLRLRMPHVSMFIEYQGLVQNDPWDPPSFKNKFIWGMSTSLKGLRMINDL